MITYIAGLVPDAFLLILGGKHLFRTESSASNWILQQWLSVFSCSNALSWFAQGFNVILKSGRYWANVAPARFAVFGTCLSVRASFLEALCRSVSWHCFFNRLYTPHDKIWSRNRWNSLKLRESEIKFRPLLAQILFLVGNLHSKTKTLLFSH